MASRCTPLLCKNLQKDTGVKLVLLYSLCWGVHCVTDCPLPECKIQKMAKIVLLKQTKRVWVWDQFLQTLKQQSTSSVCNRHVCVTGLYHLKEESEVWNSCFHEEDDTAVTAWEQVHLRGPKMIWIFTERKKRKNINCITDWKLSKLLKKIYTYDHINKKSRKRIF